MVIPKSAGTIRTYALSVTCSDALPQCELSP